MKESLMQIRRHELLEEIELLVIALCKNYNLGQDVCEQIGVSVANCLSEEYAGQVICFPKDYRYKIAQRTWIFITVLTVEIGANLGVVIIGLRML